MSRLRRVVLVALLGSSVPSHAMFAQATAPSPGLSQFLAEWVDAYNTSDSAKFELLKAKALGVPLPRPTSASGVGALVVDRVLASDAQHLEVLLRSGDAANMRVVILTSAPGNVARLASFAMITIPPGRPVDELLVTPEVTQRVVEGAARALRTEHVLPEIGATLADTLHARMRRGAYRNVATGRYLADALTAELRAVSGDRHLRVDFSVRVLPTDFSAPPTAAQTAERRRQLLRANCTFVRAERLDGNIGVLKLNGFGEPQHCASTAAAAVGFIASTETVVIDLRDNNGGDPDMVTLLSSYFFQARTRLTTMFTRAAGKADDVWSDATLPLRFADSVPVYVLTSPRTFSAGEAFAYELQMLKRATIVGEVTGGGARPSRLHRIDDHFMVNIPYARTINPVSGTDWEGAGVQPDVRVPEGEALETARRLAASRLSDRR